MASKAKRTGAAATLARSGPKLVSPAIRVQGSLDLIGADGLIEGWCWSPDQPDMQRRVAVLIDGVEAARIVADAPRDDLAAAGVGSGRHAFRLRLPAASLRPGATAAIALRDLGSGQPVGAPIAMRWPDAIGDAPGTLTGSIDRVSRDGFVSGWCCIRHGRSCRSS